MRTVIQRVSEACVRVPAEAYESSIGKGLLVLAAFIDEDTEEDLEWTAKKIAGMRIFDDENGVMNKSLLDGNGDILSISQFTLYADTRKGRRPSYIKALRGEESTILYDIWNTKLRESGINVETGIFGADMKVSLINDGPVTIIFDTDIWNKKG